MEREAIFEKIQEICKDVFDEPELTISEKTSAKDVDAWDSLTHLSLISEIEFAFDIAFTLDEVNKSKKIEDLINSIMKHINEQN